MNPALMLPERRRSWLRPLTLAILVLVLIIGPFLLFGSSLEAWIRDVFVRGPRGVGSQALCVLLLASDVFLPVPSSVVSTVCGMWWGVWLGTVVSTIGMTLGSVLGYGVGRWMGAGRVERWLGAEESQRLARLYARHGPWIVVILRPVPVLAEASTFFAGLSRMPATPFLVLSVAANLIVSIFYAALGDALRRFSPTAAFVLLIVVLALAVASYLRLRRRPDPRAS